ncbi:flagellar basal body-associated protein FliL [Barrientosiimonas marina]|uniref:Flagellar protein FliL n=1 Tax=Lentibacillus kimchii TaxID=1542911 RepID=A0ABW2UPH0_9BACI
MGKLAKTMITTLIFLLLASGITIVVMFSMTDESDQGDAQSLDKQLENSYETEEITTDLKNGSFVRIQFQIMTGSEKAKEEVVKRDFQLKNMLIKELAKMKSDDFKSGLSDLEDTVQQKLNDVMEKGQITDVYTTNKVLQ